MPYYDYSCIDCGHEFETFQNMSDDALKTCPECETRGLRRLIGGGTGVIFKGSGFYVNDSRKTLETPQKLKNTDASPKEKSTTPETTSSADTNKSASSDTSSVLPAT